MPEKEITEKAQKDLRDGKSASTAAGEFVHEEIEHVREGKHGARSPQQAIAVGLSKARRAGVPLPPPGKGKTKQSTRQSAERDYKKGQSGKDNEPSPRAFRARENVLKREPRSTVSHRALSNQTQKATQSRSSSERRSAAKKAVDTKGKSGLRQAAQKAARARSAERNGA